MNVGNNGWIKTQNKQSSPLEPTQILPHFGRYTSVNTVKVCESYTALQHYVYTKQCHSNETVCTWLM